MAAAKNIKSAVENNSKKILTLCLVQQGDKVLLGMKKKGFGAGRWNGFGGKVEAGETVEDAVKREVKEEADIAVSKIEKMGVIDFEFQGDPQILEVHVFKAENFAGEPKETEEMRPAWYDIDKIPFDSMWPDDKFWLPLFLENKKFTGRFLFKGDDSAHNTQILEHSLQIVNDL